MLQKPVPDRTLLILKGGHARIMSQLQLYLCLRFHMSGHDDGGNPDACAFGSVVAFILSFCVPSCSGCSPLNLLLVGLAL